MPVSSLNLPIEEASQVGDARRRANALASNAGLGEEDRGRLSIIVTEVATNIVKHASGGELLISVLDGADGPTLEVISIDRGPGIADIGRCLVDGYSSAGTAGNGLGAVMRLADVFDIFSAAASGTIIVARVHANHTVSRAMVEYGAVSVPIRGEVRNGDTWAVDVTTHQFTSTVIDGLGHGLLASEAAEAARITFNEIRGYGPKMVVEAADRALRPTRGAVMAIAQVDYESKQINYCGVGNISSMISSSTESRSMVSHPGTLGHRAPKIQQLTIAWPSDALLIMHSDGLHTQWNLNNYPGLRRKHPSIIAGILYRDFSRGRDDVTIFAARWRETEVSQQP